MMILIFTLLYLKNNGGFLSLHDLLLEKISQTIPYELSLILQTLRIYSKVSHVSRISVFGNTPLEEYMSWISNRTKSNIFSCCSQDIHFSSFGSILWVAECWGILTGIVYTRRKGGRHTVTINRPVEAQGIDLSRNREGHKISEWYRADFHLAVQGPESTNLSKGASSPWQLGFPINFIIKEVGVKTRKYPEWN